MTKTADIAKDAAKAAALVQETADRTATALNIQYIQKDVAEIKTDIKNLVAAQAAFVPLTAHNELANQVSALSKTVYVGIGIATAFSFVIPLFLKFFIK